MKSNLARMVHLGDTPYPLPFGALRNRQSLLSVEALATAVVDLLQMARLRQVYLAIDRDAVSTAEILTALRAGSAGQGVCCPFQRACSRRLQNLPGAANTGRACLPSRLAILRRWQMMDGSGPKTPGPA
jgi:hypothetical protein